MDYQIAIPSYRRVDIIQERTLKYLADCGIDMGRVTVFVADDEEYEQYSKALPVKVVKGVLGIGNQRNFIIDHYPEGTQLVQIDDDIKRLVVKRGNGVEGFYNFHQAICKGFVEAKKNHTKLWGISPVNNGFYMSYSISTNLKFCIGMVFGVIIDRCPSLKLILPIKVDYELTLRHYRKFGSIIRMNMIAADSVVYGVPGGLQEIDRITPNKQAVAWLLNTFPEWVSVNTKRSGDMVEILIQDR